jgi:putative NADH-flavin reductase
MRIAIIAADGRSGQAFMEAALSAGHAVRAGTRGSSHLQPHPNLTQVDCDATNEADLSKLITGNDAVASFIGHVKGSAADVQTIAIQKVIQVMGELGVSRLISLTGTGVRFTGDKITLLDRILNVSIGIIDPNRVKDGREHVEALKRSNLEWTVIRVLKLQNVSPQPFALHEHGPTKPYVGRGEVAKAVLEVLEHHSFIKEAPIIGWPLTTNKEHDHE